MIIKLKPMAEILGRRGLMPNGKAQKMIDSEVLRFSAPYLPKRSGALMKSGNINTKLGAGEVRYVTPYAQYQYHGKVMVGRAPKKVTTKPLTYIGAPKRGALWFERMKVAHKDSILRAAAKISGGHT